MSAHKYPSIFPHQIKAIVYISPSISQYNNQGQTTTLETSCLTLYDKRVGSFTSPANHFNTEDAGGGTYGLQSLSEKA